MPPHIHQIVYISRLRSPVENREAEIDAILVSARRNNARAQITGGLFVTGDIVAQLLEGQNEAVEGTFVRISTDHRHESVTLLRRRDVARRIFPTWAMGFEISADAPDEIWGIFTRAFAVQNDDIADAVTAMIRDSGIRIEDL
jgi:hypothetical protein